MGVSYKYRQLPLDRDPRWFDGSYTMRTLGLELFHAYGANIREDGDPTIPVGKDWRVSLCRVLCIEPRERHNVSRALDAARKLGLIDVFEGHVVVHFRPQLDVGKTVVSGEYAVCKTSMSGDITPRNDTTPLPQIDREIEERESGAPIVLGPRGTEHAGYRWLGDVLGDIPPDLGSWRREYTSIGAKPPDELAAVARSVRSDPWLQEKRSRITPGHLTKYWAQYLEGPRIASPLKPPQPVARQYLTIEELDAKEAAAQ